MRRSAGWTCFLLGILAFTGLGGIAVDNQESSTERPMNERLGVTHVNGLYNPHPSDTDFLNAGAEAILELGSRSIMVYAFNPAHSYPIDTTWPRFDSLVEVVQHPYYQALFDKPFTTFFLTVYRPDEDDHYWIDGITPAQEAAEAAAMEELASYLLDTYADSGKTFVLMNWEGDWAIRGNYNAEDNPTQTAIDGMIAWLNARQAGINAARDTFTGSGVEIYHAVEVSLVKQPMDDPSRPNVTNAVLPHTTVDLVSYSCWDTGPLGEEFRNALDFIADHLPDTAAFGRESVFIGEYGYPENQPGSVEDVVRNVVETGLDWGVPWLLYWQLYCNEAVNTPVETNDDVRGFWLIRPDGTRSWTYDYLQGLIEADQPEAPEPEPDPDPEPTPDPEPEPAPPRFGCAGG